MPKTYSKADEARAQEVFDLLADGDKTKPELAAAIGATIDQTKKAIHALRWMLGDTDDINVVAEPDGKGPWVYKLIGTTERLRWWHANRVQDATTRLGTINQTCRSIVAASDGRSIEGKRARIIERHTRRCLEDLHDLDNVAAHAHSVE